MLYLPDQWGCLCVLQLSPRAFCAAEAQPAACLEEG